jgi:hypothetical protein
VDGQLTGNALSGAGRHLHSNDIDVTYESDVAFVANLPLIHGLAGLGSSADENYSA